MIIMSKFYSKLFDRSSKIRENNYKLGKSITKWKEEIKNKWDGLEIISIRVPDSSSAPLSLGEKFVVEIMLNTSDIPAENIGIDLVLGQKENNTVSKIYHTEELNLVNQSGVKATFSCSFTLKVSGVFDFAFRIFPKADFLPHRQDFNLVKWV